MAKQGPGYGALDYTPNLGKQRERKREAATAANTQAAAQASANMAGNIYAMLQIQSQMLAAQQDQTKVLRDIATMMWRAEQRQGPADS